MPLPDFLIIGTAKAATTSLHAYLAQHPQVCMSRIKEANYFAWDGHNMGFPANWNKPAQHPYIAKTREEYMDLFRPGPETRAIGEASPVYLDSPVAPPRIHEEIPEAKIIVTLRNPVERVISNYRMLVRMGIVSESLDACLKPGKQLYELSFVADNLESYYALFSREHIHPVLYEDLKRQPEAVMNNLYDFLGVDHQSSANLNRSHNVAPSDNLRTRIITSNPATRGLFRLMDPILRGPARQWAKDCVSRVLRKEKPFSPGLVHEITRLYAEDVVKLEALTGMDLDAWKA